MVFGKGKAWGLEQVQRLWKPLVRLLLALQLHLFTPVVDRACPSLLYAQVGVYFFIMTL